MIISRKYLQRGPAIQHHYARNVEHCASVIHEQRDAQLAYHNTLAANFDRFVKAVVNSEAESLRVTLRIMPGNVSEHDG